MCECLKDLNDNRSFMCQKGHTINSRTARKTVLVAEQWAALNWSFFFPLPFFLSSTVPELSFSSRGGRVWVRVKVMLRANGGLITGCMGFWGVPHYKSLKWKPLLYFLYGTQPHPYIYIHNSVFKTSHPAGSFISEYYVILKEES